MERYTLLVVARTQQLAVRLQKALDGDRFLIRWVSCTARALEMDLDSPSLVLVDLPPSGGGRSVARLKRKYNAPILAMSWMGQPLPEEVDASIPRLHHMEDLVDLIETTLIKHSPQVIHAEGMSLDMEARRLQINGSLYHLRPLGCQILAVLMAEAGNVIPREELFRRVWNTDDGDHSRALDVHIAYLRSELEADPRKPKMILTERGVGYRLRPPA
jgi:two-component system KDP operon response regulator KdpE